MRQAGKNLDDRLFPEMNRATPRFRHAVGMFAALFIVGTSEAHAGRALEAGLGKFATDPELRQNWSPLQTFFIAECGHRHYKWSVYWPEARQLLWIAEPEKGSEEVLKRHPILLTKWFDLEKGVVNTEDEIAGSTFLVTESWVKEQLRCASKGRKFVVPLSIPGRDGHLRGPR